MQNVSLLKSISDDHEQFRIRAESATKATAVAVMLVLLALIVIVSACFCLALKGVNVMRHVILPAVLPGSIAILLSIPFFVRCKRQNDEGAPYRKRCVEDILTVLTSPEVSKLDKKELTEYIEKNLLSEYFVTKKWDRNYVTKLFSEIRAKFPEKKDERSSNQQVLFDALEEVTKDLSFGHYKKKFKKKAAPKKAT